MRNLRGVDGARLQGQLDLVLGPGQQFDGAILAEPLAIHLEVHGAVVGLDLEGDLDPDQGGHFGHGAGGAAGGTQKRGGAALSPPLDDDRGRLSTRSNPESSKPGPSVPGRVSSRESESGSASASSARPIHGMTEGGAQTRTAGARDQVGGKKISWEMGGGRGKARPRAGSLDSN